ncbi:MAG TPA: hypothetical protein VGN78_15065 [Solirubrobacteraceae bacterium]|jgi:hypothetical protein|nr:hypothetical protein [Solirubrobacteraceae bacterium]
MPTWAIIVLAVFAAFLLLALGGALAASLRNRRHQERFDSRLDQVDRALADARATDRGWERGALEAAARRAFEVERPGVEIHELTLVQVVDRPGTEEDKAVFRVVAADVRVRLTLGRVGGEWVGEGADAG